MKCVRMRGIGNPTTRTGMNKHGSVVLRVRISMNSISPGDARIDEAPDMFSEEKRL